MLSYLTNLMGRGFGLVISEVSYYELLSGTTTKQEKDRLNFLNELTRYLVELRVFIAASQLSTLYSQQCKRENRTSHEISCPDKIIAATAVLTGSLILTANISDFPRPFFREAEERLIFYKDHDKTQILVLQLLDPNNSVIQQKFQERPLG